jgi:hypothetical protein
MAIARVIRPNAMDSLHQQSRTCAGIFNRNASVAYRDCLGRRHGSGTASSFLANLETSMRNFRWIFCLILKSGVDPLLCHAWAASNDDYEIVWVVFSADGGYAAVGSDSSECSASRSAIARDVRSRSRIAAIAPHTTARSKAIQENRVSQRSAAMPA